MRASIWAREPHPLANQRGLKIGPRDLDVISVRQHLRCQAISPRSKAARHRWGDLQSLIIAPGRVAVTRSDTVP